MQDRTEACLEEALEKVSNLYSQPNKFFVSVPRGEVPPVYWGPKADPDGVVRDQTCEAELERWQSENRWELHVVGEEYTPLHGRWLDVGSGSGRLVRTMRDSGISAEFACVEPDRTAHPFLSGPGVTVHSSVSDALADGPFDICSALHVLEHMADPLEEVLQIRSALRYGAPAVFTTCDFASAAARAYGTRFRLLHDPTHVSLFSTDSLLRMLRACGFAICDVYYPFLGIPSLCNESNLMRLTHLDGTSPPLCGSIVSVLCEAA